MAAIAPAPQPAPPPAPVKASSPDYISSLTRRFQSLFRFSAPHVPDDITYQDARAVVENEKVREHYIKSLGGAFELESGFSQSASAQILFTIEGSVFNGHVTVTSGGRMGVGFISGDARKFSGSNATHVITGTYHWESDEAQRLSSFIYIELSSASVDIVFYNKQVEEVAYISGEGDRYASGHGIGRITWDPAFGSA